MLWLSTVSVGLIILGLYSSNIATMSEKIENLEGRIGMAEGKAILTPGRSCILDEQVLSDEALALKMTQACLRAYAMQSANSPS